MRDRITLFLAGDAYVWGDASGHEEYHGGVSPAWCLRLETGTGRLAACEIAAFEMRRFRLHRASTAELDRLRETLDRESAALGARVERDGEVLSVRPR